VNLRRLAVLFAFGALGCGEDAAGAARNDASSAGGTGASDASAGASGGGSGGGGGGGSGAGGGGGSGSGDLCQPRANTLFAHGDFEEGMDGDAPAFWQVRDPGAPAACAGSGSAAEHVFLTTPAPGCTGQALAIDSRGQWDCYAVQRVTDYDSIAGGASYRVSAVARSTGNAGNPAAWFVIGVQWLDGSDQFFGDEKNPPTASASENDYDWKWISFELVAPDNAKRMLVWLSAHYPGRVDIDNVSVEKIEP
jgi:hypothetical protein